MKKYNKLVRDNIPKIIRKNGEYARCRRRLNDEEYEKALNDKLLEEAKEVIASKTKEEITEELADLFEVILSKAKNNGITMEEINTARVYKNEKKGSFDKRVFLAYTYNDEDIKKLPRKCETCALKNSCTSLERLNENNDSKYPNGFLCVDYIPELYEQKTANTK